MASYQSPFYLQKEYGHLRDDNEKMFDLAIKEHPEDKHLLLLVQAGQYFTDIPKRQKCWENCQIIIKESTDNELLSWAYRFAAWIYQEDNKDDASALNCFLKLIEIEPDEIEIMLWLGKTYRHLKKYDEAIEWAVKAQADEDYLDQALEILGDIYLDKKEYDLALDYYNKCLELDPPSANLLSNIGIVYYNKSEFETARSKFHEGMKLNDKYEYFPYLIGICWMAEDDFYRAMDYFTKALDLHPNMPEALNGIAKLYYDHEGDYKVAIGYLEKAIEESSEPLAENMMLIYQNLGKLHSQMLNKEKADYYFRKFFECQELEGLYDIAKDQLGYGDLNE